MQYVTFKSTIEFVVSVPDANPAIPAALEANLKGIYIPEPVWGGAAFVNGNTVGADGGMTVVSYAAADLPTFVSVQ